MKTFCPSIIRTFVRSVKKPEEPVAACRKAEQSPGTKELYCTSLMAVIHGDARCMT